MKLINSSYEIVEPKSYSLEDVYKHIELCGRVCYRSYDKITPDSATKFVDRMIKSGHTLPNALKTELIMTGFASDWQHFFDLRDDSRAHPDAQKLAKPLHKEFINRKYTH